MILIILGWLSLSACEKFLEEKPKGFLTPDNFYENEQDLEAAVIGVYNGLRGTGESFLARRLQFLTWYCSGEAFSPNSAEQRQLSNYIFTADHPDINRVWTAMYSLISRANNVVSRAQDMQMDQALKDQYVGEARFLRALSYFYGVRLWGALPLVTEEVVNISEVEIARSPLAEVYNVIIADLEFAAGALPSVNQKGRASNAAAKGLLAKVYLTRASSDAAEADDYQRCAQLCQEVIDMPEHQLMPDYQQVFGPPNEHNAESLFEWQADRTIADSELSVLGSFTLPKGIRLIEAQTPSDGGGIVSTIPFFNLYEEDDYRRESTVVTEGRNTNGEWVSWKQFQIPYPAPCLKYVDRTATTRNEFAFCGNFIVLRLADVYLMRAEALNEIQGPTPEAYDLINAIRKRARNRDGSEPGSGPADLVGLDKTAFRDAVLHERAIELGFEGHRWFDLVRTGRLISTLKTAFPGLPISDKHMLFPLPPDELTLNPLLSQNPGW